MIPKKISMLRLLFAMVAMPFLAYAKGGDGIVILKGTVHDAVANGEAVTFVFSGTLSFSFFTASPDDPARRQINLEFEVRALPVRVPKFGTSEYDNEDNPYRVSFKNAATHAVEAAKSGEPVTVALFTPRLAYDVSGVIEKVEGLVAQILSEGAERSFGGWSAKNWPDQSPEPTPPSPRG